MSTNKKSRQSERRPASKRREPQSKATTTESNQSIDWLEAGLAVLDLSQQVVEINRPFAHWLGGDPAGLIGKPLTELLLRRIPDGDAVLAQVWAEAGALAEREFATVLEGQKHWFRLEISRNSVGGFVRLGSIVAPWRDRMEEGSGSTEDPEKQQLRLRLLRTESDLAKLIQRWPGVLFSQRADFSFHYVNGRIEELTGLTPEAWRSQPLKFWEVVHEADIEELKRQCAQAAKQPGGVTSSYRIRHARTGKVS